MTTKSGYLKLGLFVILGAKLDNISQKTLNGRRTDIYKDLKVDASNKDKQDYLAQEYSSLVPIVCPDENALKRICRILQSMIFS